MKNNSYFSILCKAVFFASLSMFVVLITYSLIFTNTDNSQKTSSDTYTDEIIAVQTRLNNLGYYYGPINGKFTVETGKALRNFQRNMGITPDGSLNALTLSALGIYPEVPD